MTPEEHYARAENWLSIADQVDPDADGALRAVEVFYQRAQVHATLAMVDIRTKEM